MIFCVLCKECPWFYSNAYFYASREVSKGRTLVLLCLGTNTCLSACKHSSPSPSDWFNKDMTACNWAGKKKQTIRAEIGTLGQIQVWETCQSDTEEEIGMEPEGEVSNEPCSRTWIRIMS